MYTFDLKFLLFTPIISVARKIFYCTTSPRCCHTNGRASLQFHYIFSYIHNHILTPFSTQQFPFVSAPVAALTHFDLECYHCPLHQRQQLLTRTMLLKGCHQLLQRSSNFHGARSRSTSTHRQIQGGKGVEFSGRKGELIPRSQVLKEGKENRNGKTCLTRVTDIVEHWKKIKCLHHTITILYIYILYIYISQNSKFHTLGRLGIPGVTLQNLLTSLTFSIQLAKRLDRHPSYIGGVLVWHLMKATTPPQGLQKNQTKIVGCERCENCWMIFKKQNIFCPYVIL